MQLEEALKKIALLEGVTKELDGKLGESLQTIETLEGKLKPYEELGSVEDINSVISTVEEMKDELGKYRELGDVETLDEALENMCTFTENFHSKLGNSVEEVVEALDTATQTIEAYKELGSISDIEELIQTAESLNDDLQKYENLMTIEEAEAIVESYEDDLKDIQVAKLTESFNVSEAFANEMLEKWGTFEEAEKALAEVAGSLKKTTETSETKEEEGNPEEGEPTDESKVTEGGDLNKADESASKSTIKQRLQNLLNL